MDFHACMYVGWLAVKIKTPYAAPPIIPIDSPNPQPNAHINPLLPAYLAVEDPPPTSLLSPTITTTSSSSHVRPDVAAPVADGLHGGGDGGFRGHGCGAVVRGWVVSYQSGVCG